MIEVLKQELDRWERHLQLAVAEYNKASIALETLKELTDRMREAAENEANQAKRVQESGAKKPPGSDNGYEI